VNLNGEPVAPHSQSAAVPQRKRKALPTRKVTVRLTEAVCQQLQAATERPGVGKSMVVAAALECHLSPRAPVEEVVGQGLDVVHARFDRIERDMRMIAETVALHARYHFAVMPALPPSQHQEACKLGDERFKVLAEQVDRRVRQDQPLMRETIDRLNCMDGGGPESAIYDDTLHDQEPSDNDQTSASEGIDIEHASSAAVGKGGGSAAFNNLGMHSTGRSKSIENGKANTKKARCGSISESADEFEDSRQRRPSKWRVILSVFLPFAAGYFLSFLFRTICASISPALTSEFGLDAAENGLLASVYFLVFAGAQLPIGVLLDRYGPRRVHSVLLVMAVAGAALFGNATGFGELLIGRAMMGLGVAAALTAGLKAIVIWFPKERIALVNGCMIMLGSLGAAAATKPTDWLLNCIGWRSLFEILTVATLATAGLIYFTVPEREEDPKHSPTLSKPLTLRSIFSDPRFLRVAPLSATCIGSSWAMQSLWAASWLADVEGLDRPSVIQQLFWMAIEISLGAFLLGTIADRLRKRGVSTELLLAAVGGLFILAELALVLRVPLPSILPWSVVPIAGAATVLSYAIIADYFPQEFAARANGALNLVHFLWAFAVEYGVGAIIGRWEPQDGHYPAAAYQFAFGLSLALQSAALAWSAVPWIRMFGSRFYRSIVQEDPDDIRADLTAMPMEGAILEPYRRVEW
jgi:predicted MFS family arabinose efflux permease